MRIGDDRAARAPELQGALDLLAGRLAPEENPLLLEAGASYPIWTPLFAEEAAVVLPKELEKAAIRNPQGLRIKLHLNCWHRA